MAELEILSQSDEETFRKFQKDTQKNLIDALPKQGSNLILHTQIATSPFNLSQVDFNSLKDIFSSSPNFDVYHLEGDEWEALQREWKQSSDLFIPNTPNTEDKKEGSTSEDQNPEDPPPTKEIPSKPASQSNEKKE